MPSSLIFVGLVVLWLLILVPTVARRQQEVARLSPALLGGRVLERPMRHRIPEVGVMERSGPTTVGELVGDREYVPDPRYHDLDDDDRAEIGDDGRLYRPDDDLDATPDASRDAAPGAYRFDPDGPDDDRPRADERAAYPRGDDPRDDATEGDRRSDDEAYDSDSAVDSDLDSDSDSDPDRDPYSDTFPDSDDSGTDPDNRYDPDDDLPGPQAARYRPGRGGFDPEAAAAAAQAKYTFRQRVVLALLILTIAGVAAALLVSTVFWWVAGVLGVALAGYLTYLRRQVRIEESIRARRAARLTRDRRSGDEPAEPATGADDHTDLTDGPAVDDETTARPEAGDEDPDWTVDDGEPSRVRGTGEPLGVLPARRRTVDGPASTEHESSLPRISAAPPPPVPYGTSLVDVDAEDDGEPFDLPGTHRRAAGE